MSKPAPRIDLDASVRVRAEVLPDSEQAQLEYGRAAMARFNDAIMASDDVAAKNAEKDFEAAIYRLNGGTMFGCSAGPEAGGSRLRAYCAEVPGTVPAWGQDGCFLVTVQSVRVVVTADQTFGMWRPHFALEAIDLDRPFISSTGYRSHFFDQQQGGRTVEEAAKAIIADYVRKGLEMIEANAYCRRRKALCPWLSGLPPPELQAVIETDGQRGFGF